MKAVFFTFFAFIFTKIFSDKNGLDLLNLDNLNLEITQEDIEEDLLHNQS